MFWYFAKVGHMPQIFPSNLLWFADPGTEMSRGFYCLNYFLSLSLLHVSGSPDLPVLQLSGEGRRSDKVLPRLLLRVRQDSVWHSSEKVSQVQRSLRRQRLPSHLHRLSAPPPFLFLAPEAEEGGSAGCGTTIAWSKSELSTRVLHSSCRISVKWHHEGVLSFYF